MPKKGAKGRKDKTSPPIATVSAESVTAQPGDKLAGTGSVLAEPAAAVVASCPVPAPAKPASPDAGGGHVLLVSGTLLNPSFEWLTKGTWKDGSYTNKKGAWFSVTWYACPHRTSPAAPYIVGQAVCSRGGILHCRNVDITCAPTKGALSLPTTYLRGPCLSRPGHHGLVEVCVGGIFRYLRSM